jgi:2-polyprenyl-3-methyl-5-hydroxy-6-metoxy-1,4-benzoquinol methylase
MQNLTARQQREVTYHRDFAAKNAAIIETPVGMDCVNGRPRWRWWNAFWHLYGRLQSVDIASKRVLVVGCGFGDDAIRIASLGALVSALDISPDILEIAKARALRARVTVDFHVSAAERTPFPDDYFDIAFFVDVLHHVDIPEAVEELTRILKPNGLVFGNELYTHSCLQRIRESAFVSKVLYPRMRRYIYRSDTPYITEDEHKIDEGEFAIIRSALRYGGEVDYFYIAEGRLYPTGWARLSRLDRIVMKLFGELGRFFAARIVFSGQILKT